MVLQIKLVVVVVVVVVDVVVVPDTYGFRPHVSGESGMRHPQFFESALQRLCRIHNNDFFCFIFTA